MKTKRPFEIFKSTAIVRGLDVENCLLPAFEHAILLLYQIYRSLLFLQTIAIWTRLEAILADDLLYTYALLT